MKQKWALAALALAQFVMVLDQAVMNVSISQLVEDFDTSVTTIQGVITLYSLVMAMFIVTGAKVGDIIGRRRAFIVGLVIYAVGSGLTALAPSVLVLTLGWSVLEGIGAALVFPALAALIAGNYEGRERVTAYAIMGGVAGAGIAVGPIIGGWATTMLTWRVVFVGEVILVLAILALVRYVADAPREGRKPRLDVVGAVLSSAGLGLIVLGILQSSTWGLIQPKDSPVEPLGFSLTVFVIGAGVASLAAFVRWQRHRESSGQDPLVHLDLLRIGMLRSGLASLLSQNLILMGIFFVVPLYLQIVLGFDALETGMRMLPVSITMFIFSALGARLSRRFSVRSLVRTGLAIAAVAVIVPARGHSTLSSGIWASPSRWRCSVSGMGLLASQLGNVVQSSVEASGRSEAGGLQYTSQQLGSSLGVALIGAIVIAGLHRTSSDNVEDDPRVHDEVAAQVSVAVGDGVDFITIDQAAEVLEDSSLDAATAAAVVEDYASAQLQALRAGLLVAAIIALLSLLFTGRLPSRRPQPPPAPAGNGEAAEAALAHSAPSDQGQDGEQADGPDPGEATGTIARDLPAQRVDAQESVHRGRPVEVLVRHPAGVESDQPCREAGVDQDLAHQIEASVVVRGVIGAGQPASIGEPYREPWCGQDVAVPVCLLPERGHAIEVIADPREVDRRAVLRAAPPTYVLEHQHLARAFGPAVQHAGRGPAAIAAPCPCSSG